MMARFKGPHGLVEIGSRKLAPGDIVGEPGSGAQIEGCPGVVEYLLRRPDFERAYPPPTDLHTPPPVELTEEMED
jgi:hypothetical protein